MRPTRRTVLAAAAAVAGSTAVPAAAGSRQSLTNLAHLDYLRTSVTPPSAPGHSTYGRGPIGVLWTYADRQADGSYRRIGGGPYDAATDTYSQGAYNADDIGRAAVVYLRHHCLFGSSLTTARELLRGLTYLQSPNGNVVLWMQPDGTLNPSADPVELPDPSDSGPSFWLARTVWALGEGYEVFQHVDRAFAAFLKARLELAVSALERQVLVRYGQWNVVDGRRLPAWLIVNGADATSEAVLGLAAYLRAGAPARVRRMLAQFAEGIAALSAGSTRSWPFRALLPSAETISMWHAWGAQMPSALAAASAVLKSPELLEPAVGDTAGFTPLLLTAGGPDNGWLPTPIDRTQIAYGVDARLQGLLAVNRAGTRHLASFVAGWYFGANRAGTPMYDPSTGRTYDGLAGDGTVNRNSGAESTIHGQLSMLALDASPAVARLARRLTKPTYDGLRLIEAESATSTGQVVTPPSAWTGESQWSGNAYLQLSEGQSAEWTLPAASQPRYVLPVVNLVDDPAAGTTTWTSSNGTLGTVDHGTAGPQGISAAPGVLQPVTLPIPVSGVKTRLTATATGPAQLDAVLLIPVLSSLQAGPATLITNLSPHSQAVTKPARCYTASGHLSNAPVIPPGGFAILT
ncbi:hypothetical protein ACFTSF_20580 [Kribbella sp. NPDC056951]|uniref:hypothetical protein n=1 Tax=Kribbella sp. NPDC056951 TaxID=3345978 RepID=UPI003628CB24